MELPQDQVDERLDAHRIAATLLPRSSSLA